MQRLEPWKCPACQKSIRERRNRFRHLTTCKMLHPLKAKDAGAGAGLENQLEYLSFSSMAKSEKARQNPIACHDSIKNSDSDSEQTMDQPLTIPPHYNTQM